MPGETALLVAGAVAGQGVINVYLLIAIAWVCAVLGDTVSFYLGHRLGRTFILKHGDRVGITEERYVRVEDYFEKHGGKTVLIGRFLGLVRALSPFVAGRNMPSMGIVVSETIRCISFPSGSGRPSPWATPTASFPGSRDRSLSSCRSTPG